MKNPKFFFALFILACSLAGAGFLRLQKSPIPVFLLKSGDKGAQAFGIQLFLDGRESKVTVLKLATELQKKGLEVLKSKDEKELLAFAKGFGNWPIVIGIPGAGQGWPGYLGGGLNAFFNDDFPGYFDNLQSADRLYLALRAERPPPPPFTGSEVPTPGLGKTDSPYPSPTPVPVSTPFSPPQTGVVRVEILNGCGITNAAEWVAQKLKGPGIQIVDTDNADNFRYSKTIVRTAAGSPVALGEALDRLGLSADSIEEISSPPPSVDVVVIVGKDFRKLKERARERAHH